MFFFQGAIFLSTINFSKCCTRNTKTYYSTKIFLMLFGGRVTFDKFKIYVR